jgi:hypothetical protein
MARDRLYLGMKRNILAITGALALAACVESPDLGTEVAAVKNGGGFDCDVLGCSSNSAWLGPFEFHELDETRQQANLEGLRITSFKKNGLDYEVDVTNASLVARRYWMGIPFTLSGANLVGSTMTVQGHGRTFEILFLAHFLQPLWQEKQLGQSVDAFDLRWYEEATGTARQPVCKNPPQGKDGDPLWTSNMEAIFYTGDRYRRDTLEVIASNPREAGPWFNIACAGNVLAKLAMNRHTHATRGPTVTTWQQRQAMLKMYTSDVCGTGDAFTVSGTPLKWESKWGWESPTYYATPEALWNEEGALCLGTHRLNKTPDDMDSQIATACAAVGRTLEPCSSYVPSTTAYLATHSAAAVGP